MANSEELINASVKIFERDYSIKCRHDEMETLDQVVDYLNDEMRKTAQLNNIKTVEQVAVLTALNLACKELGRKEAKVHHSKSDILLQRLQGLQNRIEIALANIDQDAV